MHFWRRGDFSTAGHQDALPVLKLTRTLCNPQKKDSSKNCWLLRPCCRHWTSKQEWKTLQKTHPSQTYWFTIKKTCLVPKYFSCNTAGDLFYLAKKSWDDICVLLLQRHCGAWFMATCPSYFLVVMKNDIHSNFIDFLWTTLVDFELTFYTGEQQEGAASSQRPRMKFFFKSNK